MTRLKCFLLLSAISEVGCGTPPDLTFKNVITLSVVANSNGGQDNYIKASKPLAVGEKAAFILALKVEDPNKVKTATGYSITVDGATVSEGGDGEFRFFTDESCTTPQNSEVTKGDYACTSGTASAYDASVLSAPPLVLQITKPEIRLTVKNEAADVDVTISASQK